MDRDGSIGRVRNRTGTFAEARSTFELQALRYSLSMTRRCISLDHRRYTVHNPDLVSPAFNLFITLIANQTQ